MNPELLARASIGYYDKKLGVDRLDNFIMLLSSDHADSRWNKAVKISVDRVRFSNIPETPHYFRPVPSQFNTSEKIQSLGDPYQITYFRLTD